MLTRTLQKVAPNTNRILVPDDISDLVRIDQASEADPGEVGMTREGVDAIWRAVEDHYRTGFQPAISLCVRRRGRIVINRSVGHSHGGAPLGDGGQGIEVCSPSTPFCVFSASKAVTAMLIHLLDERGLLHIDDRVVEYIPEFGKHGKDTITVRHVLTHRAGIPFASGGSDDDLNLIGDWDAVIRLLCEAEPESTHGRRVSYHAITGGFILGEIIQRVTGKSFTEVVETELRGPLGTSWFHFGIDRSSMPLVARSAMLGEAPTPPFSHLFKRAIGADFPRIPDIANDPRFLGAVVPSGNLVATAEEMTRFYQLLLDGGTFGGKRVFEPRTVRRARNESAYFEVDHTLVLPVRYGLGFMLGGRHVSLFGADTEFAFGHLGFTNTYTWADPARDISVALLTTGKTFVPYELWVQREILSAIAEHCPRVR